MVSTSTSLVAEVPQKLEEKIVQSSGLNKDAIIAKYGVTSQVNLMGTSIHWKI